MHRPDLDISSTAASVDWSDGPPSRSRYLQYNSICRLVRWPTVQISISPVQQYLSTGQTAHRPDLDISSTTVYVQMAHSQIFVPNRPLIMSGLYNVCPMEVQLFVWDSAPRYMYMYVAFCKALAIDFGPVPTWSSYYAIHAHYTPNHTLWQKLHAKPYFMPNNSPRNCILYICHALHHISKYCIKHYKTLYSTLQTIHCTLHYILYTKTINDDIWLFLSLINEWLWAMFEPTPSLI